MPKLEARLRADASKPQIFISVYTKEMFYMRYVNAPK